MDSTNVVSWDVYEVALCIECAQQVHDGLQSFSQAVHNLSEILRRRISNSLIPLDNYTRSEDSLKKRIYDIQSMDNPNKKEFNSPRIFSEVFSLKQNNFEYFEGVLYIAKQIDKSVPQKFVICRIWCEFKYKENAVSVFKAILRANEYCIKNKLLVNLFCCTEKKQLKDIYNSIEKAQQNTFLSEKDKKRIGFGIRYYLTFIKFFNVICAIKTSNELQNTVAPIDPLIKIIEANNIQFTDNRNKNGALWIYGGKELKKFTDLFENDGIFFYFKEEGNKTLPGVSAWWTRANNYEDILMPYGKTEKESQLSKYKLILKNVYSKGFRMQSNLELKRFKKCYLEEYKREVSSTDKELLLNIQEICFEFNGMLYLPEAVIEQELQSNIKTYIYDSFLHKTIIFYDALYDHFKDQLLVESNIVNSEMLSFYLKHIYKDNYVFEKNFFSNCKDVCIDLNADISNCLLTNNAPMFVSEIYQKLSNISSEKIELILKSDNRFIRNQKGQFFHIDSFFIDDCQISKVKTFIENQLQNSAFLTAPDLMYMIKKTIPEVVEANSLLTDLGLRNAIAYKLSDMFSFNGNLISKKNCEYSSEIVFEQYCHNREQISLRELKNFANQLKMTICFEPIYKEMIRVSKDLFVSNASVSFNTKLVDEAINNTNNNRIVSLNEISSYIAFPNCGYQWNGYLLESFVYNHSQMYKLVHNNFAETSFAGGIVRKTSKISDFEDMLVEVLANSSCSLDTMSSLDYLCERGFLIRRHYTKLPKVLTKAQELRNRNGK